MQIMLYILFVLGGLLTLSSAEFGIVAFVGGVLTVSVSAAALGIIEAIENGAVDVIRSFIPEKQ